jgi:uncharacterized protein (TIGR02246 family)
MRDEWELMRLAYRYARAVDRNDPEGFIAVFAPDATLDSGVVAWTGHEALRAVPALVDQLYQSTLHTFSQQSVTIAGDTAEGETSGIAYHLYRPADGKQTRLDWAIRYQDRFVRQDGIWLFAHRFLAVEWTRLVTL